MSQKKKKNDIVGMNRWLFVGLWAVIHAITWGMMIGLFEWLDFPYRYDEIVIFVLGGIMPGITLTIPTYWLIQKFKGIQIRWWRPASFVAWLVGAFLLVSRLDGIDSPLVLATLWFTPAFLVQAWLLRKHVKQSWLWVLAGLTGTILFLFAGAEEDEAALTWALSGGVQGLLTGVIMLALLAMPRTEKQKHELAQNNSSYEHLNDKINRADYLLEDKSHSSSATQITKEA